MYVLGAACCQQIHQSPIRRWVLSVVCVQKAFLKPIKAVQFCLVLLLLSRAEKGLNICLGPGLGSGSSLGKLGFWAQKSLFLLCKKSFL